MFKRKFCIIIAVILTVITAVGCSSERIEFSSKSDKVTPAESVISDTKSVSGLEKLGGPDENSYDFSVSVLKVSKDTVEVADILYDGDEKDNFPVKEYKLAKERKIYQKKVNKTVYSNTKTSVTKVEYEVLSYEDFKCLVNSNVYHITADVWLDSEGRCTNILVYGETTVWE